MNTIGKKNMLFGFAYMITTIALGMFLANKLGSHDPSWFESSTRKLLKTGHVHGNLEGVINIIVGFILCRYGSKTLTLTKVVSILAIVGAVCHSGVFYLAGLGMMPAMKLAPIGAISMLATMICMVVIIFKGVQEDS